MPNTHRRRDATRQFRRDGVGGVYWALVIIHQSIAAEIVMFIFIQLHSVTDRRTDRHPVRRLSVRLSRSAIVLKQFGLVGK